MITVLRQNHSVNHQSLYMVLELSDKKWKLGFSNTEKQRIKTIDTGDLAALEQELALAKDKLNCAADCVVYSCYEAGRDGFWIHRALLDRGIENIVIDSASIEVSRKCKRAKTDKVDVDALLSLLMRYQHGEKAALSVVKVPGVAEEDDRRLHRERERLVKERGGHSARIKSLLVLHGIRVDKLSELASIESFTSPAGYQLGEALIDEIQREYQRYKMADTQIKAIEKEQAKQIAQGDNKGAEQLRQLLKLKGIGTQFSYVMVSEFFSWREFTNTKEVGACAGLTPTPYDSGDSQREQGICKAGNKRIRRTMVEAAWLWLRWQPGSTLSQWFERRFAHGGKRMRRIGIVALARKLLVSLWKYLEHGELPQGAVLNG